MRDIQRNYKEKEPYPDEDTESASFRNEHASDDGTKGKSEDWRITHRAVLSISCRTGDGLADIKKEAVRCDTY